MKDTDLKMSASKTALANRRSKGNNISINGEDDAQQQHEDGTLLKKRRTKLRDLYETEMNAWRKQLELLDYVSPGDKIEEIRNKATRLKQKRENERLEYVRLQYERQQKDHILNK